MYPGNSILPLRTTHMKSPLQYKLSILKCTNLVCGLIFFCFQKDRPRAVGLCVNLEHLENETGLIGFLVEVQDN